MSAAAVPPTHTPQRAGSVVAAQVQQHAEAGLRAASAPSTLPGLTGPSPAISPVAPGDVQNVHSTGSWVREPAPLATAAASEAAALLVGGVDALRRSSSSSGDDDSPRAPSPPRWGPCCVLAMTHLAAPWELDALTRLKVCHGHAAV